MTLPTIFFFFFFFNDTATTEIYTLSLHDALPICSSLVAERMRGDPGITRAGGRQLSEQQRAAQQRSEEHTSELQSQSNLVCRLLLEKKNKTFSCCNKPLALRCDPSF